MVEPTHFRVDLTVEEMYNDAIDNALKNLDSDDTSTGSSSSNYDEFEPNDGDSYSPVSKLTTPTKDDDIVNKQFISPPSTREKKQKKTYRMTCDSNWMESAQTDSSSRNGMVRLTYRATGATYDVLAVKANKAKAALDPQSYGFLLVPEPSHCRCARICTKAHLTAGAVLNLRRPIWESDESVPVEIARLLRSTNAHLSNPSGLIAITTSMTYKIEGRPVCGAYWALIMGVSDHTMRNSRRMAKNNRMVTTHAGTGMTKGTVGEGTSDSIEAADSVKVYSWWFHYFEVFAQRPNDETRLFPTAETFASLYLSQFLPYAKRQQWTKIPGERVFAKVAKTHPDFADDTEGRIIHTVDVTSVVIARRCWLPVSATGRIWRG